MHCDRRPCSDGFTTSYAQQRTDCRIRRSPTSGAAVYSSGPLGAVEVERCVDESDMTERLRIIAQHSACALCVAKTWQELAMPPKTTLDQANHFGMFMMKAVLDGRGRLTHRTRKGQSDAMRTSGNGVAMDERSSRPQLATSAECHNGLPKLRRRRQAASQRGRYVAICQMFDHESRTVARLSP